MRSVAVLMLACALAACGGAPAPAGEMPTRAELPTLPPTAAPTATFTAAPTLTPTASPPPTTAPPPTVTVTPSVTITDTPTFTPTPTATATPRVGALSLLALLAAQVTVLPPTYQPLPATLTPAPPPGQPTLPAAAVVCAYPPPGGFGAAFSADPALAAQLGCPVGAPPAASSSASAYQPFERGAMVWLGGPIYALLDSGRFQRFDDTFVAGVDPDSGGETPPSGLVEPVRGFGKVWRSAPDVRASLGWGLAAESGGQAALQRFERGWMLYLPQRGSILALVEDAGGLAGTWRALPGAF